MIMRAIARLARPTGSTPSGSTRASRPELGSVSPQSTGPSGPPDSGSICLSTLPAGSRATLTSGELPDEDRRLLTAMGLSERSPMRVCRQGEPCIVEVHNTRVGLARSIAERLLVTPVAYAT